MLNNRLKLYFLLLNVFYYNVNQICNYRFRRMGCQQSNLSKNQSKQIQQQQLTCTSQASQSLQAQISPINFLDRMRGEVVSIYHFSKVLSRGSTIIRSVMDRNSHINRICKFISLHNKQNLVRAYQEAGILKNLSHPNIVQIIESFNQNNFLYIILEQLIGKTLYQAYNVDQIRTLDNIIDITKQILIAINYLHQKGFVHRAIQPDHIMLVKLERSKKYLVKIIGFGKAIKIGAKNIGQLGQTNPIYSTPLKQQYCPAQDLWSVGVLFLQLMAGVCMQQKFLDRLNQLVKQIVQMQYYTQQEQQIIRDFIFRLLEKDSKRRITASQALQHPFFRVFASKQIKLKSNASVLNKLMHFKAQSKLKSLLTIYASLNIFSVADKSEHLVQFYNLDTNKDGTIDINELAQGFVNTFNIDIEVARQRAQCVFIQCKKQLNESLSFHDYVMATTFMTKDIYDKAIVKIFEQLDLNRDGIVTKQQLAKCIQGLYAPSLMKQIKKDINFKQFKKIMYEMFDQMGKQKKHQ